MSSRNERRIARQEFTKTMKSPAARRLADRDIRTGIDIEVHRLQDDGAGNTVYFNVRDMRAWCEKTLEPLTVQQDAMRAQHLVDTGAVDISYIKAHTVKHKPAPIIVCIGAAGPGEDHIVDGAHRYVAMCMGAMLSEVPGAVFAYVLTPGQWRQFVMPNQVAEEIVCTGNAA